MTCPACPVCLAVEGLALLRALNAGHDASWAGASFKLNGKPLCHSTQAGIVEGILEQVASGRELCRQHGRDE